MDDDIGAVLERPAQIRRCERVVDDERDARAPRDAAECFDVGNVELRIADRFRVDCFGVGFSACLKLSGSSASTNVVSMPNCANVTANCEYVPPYSVRDATR
jgi:hypothetical protein